MTGCRGSASSLRPRARAKASPSRRSTRTGRRPRRASRRAMSSSRSAARRCRSRPTLRPASRRRTRPARRRCCCGSRARKARASSPSPCRRRAEPYSSAVSDGGLRPAVSFCWASLLRAHRAHPSPPKSRWRWIAPRRWGCSTPVERRNRFSGRPPASTLRSAETARQSRGRDRLSLARDSLRIHPPRRADLRLVKSHFFTVWDHGWLSAFHRSKAIDHGDATLVTENLRDRIDLVEVLARGKGKQLFLKHREPRRCLRQVNHPRLEFRRLDRHSGDLILLCAHGNRNAPCFPKLLDQRRPGADILSDGFGLGSALFSAGATPATVRDNARRFAIAWELIRARQAA